MSNKIEINGCGVPIFDVPEFGFHDVCNQHDINYQTGSLTRYESDVVFLDGMKELAADSPTLIALAFLYFIAVRICGWMFFSKKLPNSKP